MAKNRLPVDFNVKTPERIVTDPARAEAEAQGIPIDLEYPKHLVKPDLDGPGGPATRELEVAKDAAHEHRLRAQGFGSHQEADAAERKAKGAPAKAPKAPKVRPAKKPVNRKPKAPKAPVQ
jgi:hypothetical protein